MIEHYTFRQYKEGADALKVFLGSFRPRVLLVLGSGLGSLGDEVDLPSARAILSNLVQSGALEENMGRALLAAVGDKALAAVPKEKRDCVRAAILKQVLILQV